MVQVSDSAGVRIVENLGPATPLGMGTVEIARLLPPDGALTAFPWGVAVDPGVGRIHVVDQTSPRVVVFDREGRYLRTLGRRGQERS